MSKKLIYFAHPISLYNTLVEMVIIEALTRRGFRVVNPGEIQYQRAYEARRYVNPKENPMAYWLELADTCTDCAFIPFPQTHGAEGVPLSNRPRVSAGVIKEVNLFFATYRQIYWILPDVKLPEEVTLLPFGGWNEFEKLTVQQTLAVLRANECKI